VVVEAPAYICHLTQYLAPGDEVRNLFLVQRKGSSKWMWVPGIALVAPGDRLVIYNIELGKPGEIERANLLYNEIYYVDPDRAAASPLWPDERAVIDAHIPSRSARIVEICCGTGRVTAHLERDGNEVWGVDNSPPNIAFAQETASEQVHYLLGDAAQLPFEDAFFDVGTCWENSLGEFFVNQTQVLHELVRTCKPGGKLVFGFRAMEDADDDVQLFYADGYFHIVQTFPRTRTEELMDALQEACPEVVTRENLAGGPRPWGGEVYYLVLGLAP
jgi:ubiquinone/menaquinone biosynthesis C-methylase UbiE